MTADVFTLLSTVGTGGVLIGVTMIYREVRLIHRMLADHELRLRTLERVVG